MSKFNLAEHEITVETIHRNLPPSALYEHAIRFEKDARIAEGGALVAYSGAKTGRSPKDKRVVKNAASEKDVWWGPVNIPLDPNAFAINRERARAATARSHAGATGRTSRDGLPNHAARWSEEPGQALRAVLGVLGVGLARPDEYSFARPRTNLPRRSVKPALVVATKGSQSTERLSLTTVSK